jgi:hypothetical protein
MEFSMPRITLKVTDPRNGQLHEIDAKQIDQVSNSNPAATGRTSADAADGKIDLFVRSESNWSGISTKHLQIDAGRLSSEQAAALNAAVESGNSSSLRIEGQSGAVSVRSDLAVELNHQLGAPVAHDPSRSLEPSASPIMLSNEGVFSTETDAARPLEGRIAGLSRAAEAADQLADGRDLFSHNQVSTTVRAKALGEIQSLLSKVESHESLPADEKAKARSAAATLTHELIRGLGNEGEEGQLKRAAFTQYAQMVRTETVGGLKDSMIFNAVQQRAFLPADLQKEVDGMKAQIAPTTLPYDKWFADGKRELNISYAAGHGENFYEGMTEFLQERGYSKITEGGHRDPRHLQMKKTVNGEEYTVNIDLRHFSKDSFKDIDNPKYDMIVYGGHSNLGGNTRKSLDNAPEATGKDKLVFLGLCSGKDNLDGVRKAFPEAQLVTTFNSSYFYTKPTDGGGKQFTTGEDAKALTEMIEGALRQDDWQTIGDNIRKRAVGRRHHKELGNYLTPIDTQFNARFLDGDGDGSADLIDRHFNIETVKVGAQPSGSLTPTKPAEGKLNGELPARASHFANTIDLYNPTYDKFSHKGRIVSDGYFQGKEGDAIVAFDTVTEDGRQFYKMQVNDRYSGASEEALRAITMVEYHNHLASTEADFPIKDPVKSAVTGLMTAVASLKYDQGYNDQAVFSAIKSHYGLPEGVKLKDAKAILQADRTDYTGSLRLADQWLDKMDDSTKEALARRFGSE